MRRSAGHHLLFFLGGLCATVGIVAWIVMAWKGAASIDEIEAHSDEGSSLLVWALVGTLLMIVGGMIMHIAQAESE